MVRSKSKPKPSNKPKPHSYLPSPSPSPTSSPRPSSPEPRLSPVLYFASSPAFAMASSRPQSMPLPPRAAVRQRSASPPAAQQQQQSLPGSPPTLAEVLANTSSPPYTLAAFMGYLSQNHCMETLEFTMDSQRYAAAYNHALAAYPGMESATGVRDLWSKLMETYIIPCSPREINIPSRVRESLLAHQQSVAPPHPSELDTVVDMIHELMNDSVLVPFIESVTAQTSENAAPHESRFNPRSVLKASRHPSHRSSPSSPGLLQHQQFNMTHHGGGGDSPSDSTASSEFPDDNPSSPHSPGPMTPPATPPTSDSPMGFHRVVAAHNNAWKKVLGLNKKKKSPQPPSAGAGSSSSSSQGQAEDPSSSAVESSQTGGYSFYE